MHIEERLKVSAGSRIVQTQKGAIYRQGAREGGKRLWTVSVEAKYDRQSRGRKGKWHTSLFPVFTDTSGKDLMRAVMYIRQDLYFTAD